LTSDEINSARTPLRTTQSLQNYPNDSYRFNLTYENNTICVFFASAGFAHAGEPASLIRAINAVDDARNTLIADLALDPEARDEIAACPSEPKFDKILRDEKTYNAAVKAWRIAWNTP
jgi:hypothetical protein